ncbi:ABC transporter substrate-binding protein [Deinococcus altitudinis]|uniref:ABC transporter substrate-binding protein n=1 Tax=Deinococcus altitudinis TaxID=468914 RepID=UPI0038921EDC
MKERPAEKIQAGTKTRRAIVKTFAVAVAASLTGAGAARVAGVTAASAPVSALRIGVLLPANSVYPGLARRYLNGLNLALGAPSLRATELVVSSVGSGPCDLEAAAQNLLSQAGAELLIALGDGSQARLRDLAEHHHVPLIVSELGGLMPRGERKSPFVFSNSLQLWQAEWALGTWSAHHLGRRAQVVTSLMESGYDLPYAFGAGFSAAGGTVLGTSFADNFSREQETIAALADTRQLRPDHIHLISTGALSAAFISVHQRTLSGQLIPVSTSGLALAEPFRTGGVGAGHHSALSWVSDLNTAQNRSFTAAYQRVSGQAADAVAALGHETGSWLLSALSAVGGQTERTQAWLQALANASFHSPRGEIQVDAQSHQAQAPIYLRRSEVLAGRVNHRFVTALKAPPAGHPALQVLTETPRTGWSTPYLHA